MTIVYTQPPVQQLQQPSPYGRRLLPHVLDQLAAEDPNRILYYTCRGREPSAEPVTATILANAVNHLSWWLETQFKDLQDGTRVVGYIGPNDLRYFILMIASVKAGIKVLLSSPRNSIDGHTALIQASNCHTWLIPSDPNFIDVISEISLPRVAFPTLSELLDAPACSHYQYDKPFDIGKRDILAYLHTSGSTGLPKLIPLYLETGACIDAFHNMEQPNGQFPTGMEWEYTRLLNAMPLFHTAGICLGLFSAIFFNWTVVLPPIGQISVHLIEEAMDMVPIDSAFIPPSALNQMAKSESSLAKLSELKFVTSAGGPVAQYAGDLISQRTVLQQTMGSTEGQWYATLPSEQSQWNHMKFAPQIGCEMVLESPGLYELVFKKQPQLAGMQTVFSAFPELDTWHTKDLYSAHPDIPNHWKFEGRKDDIIVLSNGEKFNPVDAEAAISKHPWVHAACLVGAGRFQVALLVQPMEGLEQAKEAVVAGIWSAVEEQNLSLPGFAKIHRPLVLVVNRPFVWTPKGTLSRNATNIEFAADINQLYEEAQRATSLESDVQLDLSNIEYTQQSLLELVQAMSQISSVGLDQDFFHIGLDSLMVQSLQTRIQEAIGDVFQLTSRIIYENPNVQRLSLAIWNQLQDPQHSQSRGNNLLRDSRRLLSQYSTAEPSTAAPCAKTQACTRSVILTGSTGYIGSYLLDNLVNDASVTQVWCLNRSDDAAERQEASAKSKGLSCDWKGKVTFLTAAYHKPQLGLSGEIYETLLQSVDCILHIAWQVDFNLSLPSFERQIAGTKNFLELASRAKQRVRFCFASSIAVAANWPRNHVGPVPEGPIYDLSATATGYGASKLVAERMLQAAASAAEFHDVDIVICRIGQVGGPVRDGGRSGVWNQKEWLPTIIDTSAKLQALPSSLGSADTVDWVPIDIAADAIYEQTFATPSIDGRAASVYHVINPVKTGWSSLTPIIKERLENHTKSIIEVVSLKEWTRRLSSEASQSTARANELSGYKLAAFYESLAEEDPGKGGASGMKLSLPSDWELSRSLAASKSLGSLTQVTPDWMNIWLSQWGY